MFGLEKHLDRLVEISALTGYLKGIEMIETYREKTDYFEKPSTIRRKKKIRRLRAIKKANQSKDL